jgi:hypothetical protein
MIVVLLSRFGPPRVLEMTREDVVAAVSDTSATGSYVASIPPGLALESFEGAWSAMTKDMKLARHFETPAEATAYFNDSAGAQLSVLERAHILSALRKL